MLEILAEKCKQEESLNLEQHFILLVSSNRQVKTSDQQLFHGSLKNTCTSATADFFFVISNKFAVVWFGITNYINYAPDIQT